MDLKEIGNKLVLMLIKWFLEDPARIHFFAAIVLSMVVYAIAYPLAYIADKKLEAEEEWKKNKTGTEQAQDAHLKKPGIGSLVWSNCIPIPYT